MSMIGNRFTALKLNVQDPFSKSKTRIKRVKPLGVKEKKVETPVKINTVDVEETQIQIVKPQSKMAKKAVIVVVDLKAAAIKKESAQSVVTTFDSVEGGVNESVIVDDDRGTQNRSHYKKMIDSGKGRMMDRQGGAKTKGKTGEKRHGHGVYNWGDQIDADDGKLDVDSTSAQKEEHVAEVNVPKYTLAEFKEFQKDNKVSPLLWGETGPVLADAAAVTSQDDEFDVREYQYRRNVGGRGQGQSRGQGRPRRGDSSRPPMSGENRNNEKPFVARGNREARGSRGGYRGQSTRGVPRGTINKEVRIDDQSDFPDINRFN